LWKYGIDITTIVIDQSIYPTVNILWKSVEKQEIALRLCSHCTGDYEDPDRTAWIDEPPETSEPSWEPSTQDIQAIDDEEAP
jgi:hypothetical protein